ncbi:MAG TPA: AMP-binding protein, partial [Chloroflexota bacterium]|nr:AMP-binding protein [Chloroflexota bacterium]
MATDITEGTVLWEPSIAFKDASNMTAYMRRLEERRGLRFDSYDALWQWSVDDLPAFWESIWERFDIRATQPYETVLAERGMPGAVWFPGARINYAEQVFRNETADYPAILFRSERHPLTTISWDELRRQTAAVVRSLRAMGVGPGDRVAAFVPNIPQAVVGLLACASIGAIWSSCSTDFGTQSVVDRFRQIEPAVLIAADGYQYGGKSFSRIDQVREIQAALPSLRRTVLIPYLNETVPDLPNTVSWDSLLEESGDLAFEPVSFDHPLWVLYSSGTTGLPKPIVQGQGGIMLEHLKMASLHHDLKPGDRFFWFTTTGWMMWNYLVGGLLAGTTIVLYDGSPAYPNLNALWELAAETRMTCFGTSAAYLTSCMKAGIEPGTS